jgi:hypothetical protein
MKRENVGLTQRTLNFWKDIICMELLNEGILLDTIHLEENKRAKKRIITDH